MTYLRWCKWREKMRERLLIEAKAGRNKIAICCRCGNPCVPDNRIYDEILCPVCAEKKLNQKDE